MGWGINFSGIREIFGDLLWYRKQNIYLQDPKILGSVMQTKFYSAQNCTADIRIGGGILFRFLGIFGNPYQNYEEKRFWKDFLKLPVL